mgnify:CR=1 FL=1
MIFTDFDPTPLNRPAEAPNIIWAGSGVSVVNDIVLNGYKRNTDGLPASITVNSLLQGYKKTVDGLTVDTNINNSIQGQKLIANSSIILVDTGLGSSYLIPAVRFGGAGVSGVVDITPSGQKYIIGSPANISIDTYSDVAGYKKLSGNLNVSNTVKIGLKGWKSSYLGSSLPIIVENFANGFNETYVVASTIDLLADFDTQKIFNIRLKIEGGI